MKKLLIVSLIINVAAICYLVIKKYSSPVTNTGNVRAAFMSARKEIQASLPIDSTDVVLLGNSITEGFPMERFSKDVKNRGISGSQIYDIHDRLPRILLARPKKIFLMAGTNDLKNGAPVEKALSEIKEVITAIKRKGIRLYVQSVLPVSGLYSHYAGKVVEFNNGLKSYCLQQNIEYIDLHSRMTPFSSMSYDGLHLSKRGYDVWFNVINPIIQK